MKRMDKVYDLDKVKVKAKVKAKARVTVRFFASLREKFGDKLVVEVKDVEDLLLKLKSNGVEVETCKIAVNGEMLQEKENKKLEDGDCVDVLPPFSGG